MYSSTAFPVPMGRGAAFDPDLEARIGDAIGVEARVQGANLFAGVCINLLRHPAWGRAQETYGEDTFLLGELGAALVRGTQRHVAPPSEPGFTLIVSREVIVAFVACTTKRCGGSNSMISCSRGMVPPMNWATTLKREPLPTGPKESGAASTTPGSHPGELSNRDR